MRNTALALILACCGAMLAACGKQTVTSIAGKYEGNYFGGVERFTLTADGKFTQLFTANGKPVYTNQGTWSVQEQIVTFSNLLQAFTFADTNFAGFRSPLNDVRAKIPVGTSVILFNDDGDYFVRKK